MATEKAGPPGPDQRSETLVRQHAFVRGSTAKFYEWFEESKGKLPAGPCIWICGDCHVGNLGPLADFDANVNIQIRDLTSLIWRKTNSSRSISRKISALR